MKTNYTPGPWTTWSDSAGTPTADVYTETGRCICQSPDDSEESMANAQLITSAPELLQALSALLFQSENNIGDCGIYDQARAALAKATGETK